MIVKTIRAWVTNISATTNFKFTLLNNFSGGFGFVDLVIDVHTKKEFVLKRCNVDRIESMEIVKKEINILQRFAGPYMVELLASDIIQKNKSSREALLLMEYYPGGHLLDRLNMRNGVLLPQESIYRMFGQVLLCVKTMHLNKPPIVHRDLKLENILFGSVRHSFPFSYISSKTPLSFTGWKNSALWLRFLRRRVYSTSKHGRETSCWRHNRKRNHSDVSGSWACWSLHAWYPNREVRHMGPGMHTLCFMLSHSSFSKCRVSWHFKCENPIPKSVSCIARLPHFNTSHAGCMTIA